MTKTWTDYGPRDGIVVIKVWDAFLLEEAISYTYRKYPATVHHICYDFSDNAEPHILIYGFDAVNHAL